MSTKRNKKQDKNDDRRVCAMNVDDKWKEELLKEVRELKLNQEKMAAENSALNKEVERLRYLEQLRSVPVPASTSVAAPVVKPLLPPGSASQQRVCFACNNPGHMAKNCPQNSAARRVDDHTRQTYEPHESLNPNHKAYLRVAICSQVYDCLLDTGSGVSLFPEHVIGSAIVKTTNRTLKAANGSEIPILGEVNLTVEIGSYSTQVLGLVSDRIPEPVLGLDFLSENVLDWDFVNGKIWIADKPYLLRYRSEETNSDATEKNYMVKAIPTVKGSTAKTKDIESTAVEKFLSLKDLHFVQKADPDISYIMHLMEHYTERPCWEAPTNQTYDFRALWEMWPRLKIWNGILYRGLSRLTVQQLLGRRSFRSS